jgi:hypothetical protein
MEYKKIKQLSVQTRFFYLGVKKEKKNLERGGAEAILVLGLVA